jgi:hypothetical protein
MKVFSLSSWDSGANYFISLSDTNSQEQSVSVMLNVQEIAEHAQYKISLIRPSDHKTDSVIIHGRYLTMDNLTIIGINFTNNIQDIVSGIEPYETSMSEDSE